MVVARDRVRGRCIDGGRPARHWTAVKGLRSASLAPTCADKIPRGDALRRPASAGGGSNAFQSHDTVKPVSFHAHRALTQLQS
jgi:hypothetical protein